MPASSILRKSLIITIVGFSLIFGLSSCSDAEPAQQTGDTVTLMVPAFDELSAISGSKGLTDMFNGTNYFNCFTEANSGSEQIANTKNLFLSYAVMTTTPITPSLRPVSNVSLGMTGSLNSLKAKLKFDAYGFHIEVDDLDLDLSKNKVMIRYSIIENDEVVGTIDYVYNWQEKTFSYRECVMLSLFGDTVPVFNAYSFGALVLEMHDVKLETDLFGNPTGAYSTGIMKNGNLEKNAFVDFVDLAGCDTNNGFKSFISIERSYLTVSSNNGVIYSMAQPSEGSKNCYYIESIPFDNPVKVALSSFYLDPSTISSALSDAGNDYSRKDLMFGWSQIEPHNFKMDFLMNLFDLLYTNSSIMETEGAHDISTVPEVKAGILIDDYVGHYAEKFVAYDVNANHRVGASNQFLGNSSLDAVVNKNWYNFCNFSSFNSEKYRSYEDTTPRSAIIAGLIEDHARNCGITDSNYINNFILCEKYSSRYNHHFYNDTSDHVISAKVTNSDSETFKSELESTPWIADAKNKSLILETAELGVLRVVLTNSSNSNYCGEGYYSISPFVGGYYKADISTSENTLTSLDYSRRPNSAASYSPANDEVFIISIPNIITTVENEAITTSKFTNLSRVEVTSSFNNDSLPEGIKAITVVVD